jgi:anti-sigma-K factor RskA
MKKTPERVESLAAQYVLGSLKGGARRRFERWMMESYRVREEVWYWEAKLGELADAVPGEKPPERVWSAIESRLWPQQQAPVTPIKPRSGWFWPSWGALATAAALVLSVLLVNQPEPEPWPLLSGAVVQENVKDPLWLVSERAYKNQLRMRPVAATQADIGKDYELWIVPDSGSPLSLGVVPVGDVYQVTLTDEARNLLSQSRTLAISLEPAGGSPTGAPTGPILHVTRLYEL